MSFKDDLIDDLSGSFFNEDEFGEIVTLVRDGKEYSLNGLYDELPLQGENMGGGMDAISHNPRLFVSASSLPGGKPCKGDVFVLGENEFHEAKRVVAKGVEFPKDGVVVYYMKDRASGSKNSVSN